MATGSAQTVVAEFGTPSVATFYAQGDTWSAPGNGIAVARVTWNTSTSPGYAYLYDSTDQSYAVSFSTPNSNGFSVASSFPVLSGHQYLLNAYANAESMAIVFYPFV